MEVYDNGVILTMQAVIQAVEDNVPKRMLDLITIEVRGFEVLIEIETMFPIMATIFYKHKVEEYITKRLAVPSFATVIFS